MSARPIASLLGALSASALVTSAVAIEAGDGATLFARECSVCHGKSGRGDGPAAPLCDPRPRDFHKGLYKLRSTESGELPTDTDLARTIRRGIPGTGMPSFRHLGDSAIGKLVAYVKTLGSPPDETGSWFDVYEVPAAESVPSDPTGELDPKRARRLYADMGCDGCHGKEGRGDGKKPEEMLDDWGRPLPATSFRTGIYKGGHRPEDLYLRILTGMAGTPMPGFWKDVMTPEERWTLVRWIVSLGPPRDIEQPSGEGVVAVGAVEAAPATADDPQWAGVEPSPAMRMPLSGGGGRVFEPIEVRALRDDTRLALRLSWSDGKSPCADVRALFDSSGVTGRTFAVGTPEAPLRVWTWTEGEPASVLDAIGPATVRPVKERLDVSLSLDGPRRAIVLRGSLSVARRVLFQASDCETGSALTSSTFHTLEFR